MQITRIRHLWPENAGFQLMREQGAGEYILLHFCTPVTLVYGGETRPVPAWSFIVFSPRAPHGFTSPGPLCHDWMHLRGDVPTAMAQCGLAPDTLYLLPDGGFVTQTAALLEQEFFARRPYWEVLADGRLRECFALVSRAVSDPRPTPCVAEDTARRLREARAQLLAHAELPWRVQDIAQRVHLSPPRLHAVYRALFGLSPMRDLICMRMEKARALLTQGISVAETAERCGYAGVSHFIRQFHQEVGVTPGAYTKSAPRL